jgi:hypothetical protein
VSLGSLHWRPGAKLGGGGGGGSSARVAQLALIHVCRVLGVVRWLGGRGIGGKFFGRWRRPTGVGALACRSGRDPTINMRWKGGGETIVMGLWGDSNFLSLEIIISLSFRVHPGNGTILKSSKKTHTQCQKDSAFGTHSGVCSQEHLPFRKMNILVRTCKKFANPI